MPVRERTRKELEKHPLYRDAFTMQNILVPYVYFRQRELCRKAVLRPTTYEQAESTCDFVRSFLGVECSPADFMDKESRADEAIEHHKRLEKEIEWLSGFDRECLLAFYHHIQHRMVSVHFEMGGFVTYPQAIGMFILWANGLCTLQELKGSIVRVSLIRNAVEPVDSVYFRRDMIRIYNLYNEIRRKKAKRWKRQGKEA